ncbi:hypothetical protein G6F56_003045 [Rhizopus delemar]|uniref:DUF221-domain-containing protein n=1 Tax=Rhizopus stolonifer TaxID=4846 RepID=A0A367KPT7_RHIST|nr:hypothetical protein G6F56_003045 [Rhizopus delemar]RCI04208.1 hypothetical protein CU098_007762 [Rhizopus stolonifer]
MSTYISFEDQRKQDASFTIKAMGIQLGINAATALVTMACFSFLRPRNTLVYSPKIKFMKKEHQPPVIASNGYFSWIKPILKVKDEELLDKIGCDALLYIRFVRLLRQLFFWMTILGVCALIPIYVVATKYTGDWPPESGSIDTLSLSGINYVNGKTRTDLNTVWYWSPFAATYLYSILIGFFMYRASCDYIEMRQHWFRLSENEVSMKSLMISAVPKEMRTNEKFKKWVESTYRLDYPIKETLIGYQSPKLTEIFEEHKEAVHRLESTLAAYLSDGKDENKKRPSVRVGGFLCFGGKKMDAIEHYTKQVSELEREIKALRQGERDAKAAPYGWISFDRIEWAHSVERSLVHQPHVRLSPTPQDLIWPNLPLDDKTRKAKRWMGRLFYWVFVFAWMIPMTALSATSNLINLIRMIPNSSDFIENHGVFMGLVQSYFTPIIMAIFFYLLPILFRFLSKQQGYWTQTTLDRKVLVKLYVFFIINNLLVFTLTSIFVGIYGQIKALVEHGTTTDSTDYIMQLAKNISQVANFWINYVCLHSLGLTMELAMIVPLITITLRKFLTRPSPAELRDVARPPEFDYPKNYNLLLFFFTVSLLYSAMSPLILPFAFLYFAVASMVYKYLLVYVYQTRMESGGKIWPVLFQTLMASTVLFQCIMIIVLVFKGGRLQAYLLIPLVALTLAYQYFYYRRMASLGSYLVGSAVVSHKATLKSQFRDPAYNEKLTAPTVHEDVKHLLPKVYQSFRKHEALAHQYSKHLVHEIDIDKKIHHDMVQIHEPGMDLQFEAVTEEGITEKQGENEPELSRFDSGDSLSRQISVDDRMPLLLSSQPPPRSNLADENYHEERNSFETMLEKNAYENPYENKPEDKLKENASGMLLDTTVENTSSTVQSRNKTIDRNVTSEYIEMYQMFTPNPSALSVLQENVSVANLLGVPSRRYTLPLESQNSHDRRLSLPRSILLTDAKPVLARSKSMVIPKKNPFDDLEQVRRQSF